MTQEEKAKAYDEALERAREIKSKILSSHLSTESCKAVSEYIDTIVPELAESEDEKRRKAIKCYVEDMPDTYGFAHGIGKKEMLSYLEKQKEQKPISGNSEKPNTQWSEEDETAFGDLMWCIEQARKSAKDVPADS